MNKDTGIYIRINEELQEKLRPICFYYDVGMEEAIKIAILQERMKILETNNNKTR